MSRSVYFWTPAALLAAAAAGLLFGQAGSSGGKELYVVTHIDVSPNGAADTAKAVAQFAIDSRKDAGSVRFEALRSTDRSNHFEVVEVWRTRQDFEAHQAQEHAKRFRERIQPYLGSPFDERLYYALE